MVLYQHPGGLIEAETKYITIWENTLMQYTLMKIN